MYAWVHGRGGKGMGSTQVIGALGRIMKGCSLNIGAQKGIKISIIT